MVYAFALQYEIRSLLQYFNNKEEKDSGTDHHLQCDYEKEQLKGWKKFQENNLFCDVNLFVCDTSYAAHRSLLAASSDYFKAMFKSKMKESREKDIKINAVTEEGFKAYFDFLYCGELDIHSENAQDFISTATFFQSQAILAYATSCLESDLSVQNCILYFQIAQLYHLPALHKSARDAVLKWFDEILNNTVQELSYEQLSDVLQDENIWILDEIKLFYGLAKWFHSNEEMHKECIGKLLQFVRLSLISEKLLKKLFDEEISMMSLCSELVNEAMKYHQKIFSQPILQTPRTQLRLCNAQDKLVITDFHSYPSICTCNVPSVKSSFGFKTLTHKPNLLMYSSATVFNNFMFIAGGYCNTDNICSAAAYRYDPRSNSWLQLPSMKTARCHFYLGAYNNKLYAVCGIVKKSNEEKHNILTKSVECYDPTTNAWTYVASYCMPLYGLSGSVCNNKLYITGGRYMTNYYNTVSWYDDKTDRWKCRMRNKTYSWCDHTTVTVDNKLYRLGGSVTPFQEAVNTTLIYYYVPDMHKWEFVASIPNSNNLRQPAVAFEGCIYILYKGNNFGHKYLWIVYNTVKHTCTILSFKCVSFPVGQVSVMKC
ncbi:kelch-like protein 36 [Saccoglossus kowalevskii]|uniref:Kelch-like protein 13-like n=1 Tax=Saccoglossus kowalevskii TaxID=10224 RepID=A0ABM0MJX1_SACKO|nr:PREDICTED: kelch-like protein 13-like [Saccoglossus kowalevskii]